MRYFCKICVLGIITGMLFGLVGCGSQAQKDATVLTLAVIGNEATVKKTQLVKYVEQYNSENKNVQIEVVNYPKQNETVEESINRLKIEISAGKGPDMINFGDYYSPVDASCGMMIDLIPYFQREDFFASNEYYSNIIQSFEMDGKLYALVPNYSIGSFATTNAILKNSEQISIQVIEEAYISLGNGAMLFPGETQMTVLGMLCYGNLESFIDWDRCEGKFEDIDFKNLLKFAAKFPSTIYIPEEFSAKKAFEEGKCLLYPAIIDDIYKLTGIRILLGEMPQYIGYPTSIGCGNVALIEDVAVGITEVCSDEEAAWAFIKSLLSNEYQDNIKNGFPVCVKSFEDKLENSKKITYDENGKEIVKSRIRFEGEDSIDVYQINEDDAEMIICIIQSIEKNGSVDMTAYSIILEEAQYFFQNQKEVENVAKTIQNRVNLYLNEK